MREREIKCPLLRSEQEFRLSDFQPNAYSTPLYHEPSESSNHLFATSSLLEEMSLGFIGPVLTIFQIIEKNVSYLAR